MSLRFEELESVTGVLLRDVNLTKILEDFDSRGAVARTRSGLIYLDRDDSCLLTRASVDWRNIVLLDNLPKLRRLESSGLIELSDGRHSHSTYTPPPTALDRTRRVTPSWDQSYRTGRDYHNAALVAVQKSGLQFTIAFSPEKAQFIPLRPYRSAETVSNTP